MPPLSYSTLHTDTTDGSALNALGLTYPRTNKTYCCCTSTKPGTLCSRGHSLTHQSSELRVDGGRRTAENCPENLLKYAPVNPLENVSRENQNLPIDGRPTQPPPAQSTTHGSGCIPNKNKTERKNAYAARHVHGSRPV